MKQIDADAFRKDVLEDIEKYGYGTWTVLNCLNRQPTVGVAWGSWERRKRPDGKEEWFCTVCEKTPLCDAVGLMKYCHHCGARMGR